jgi:hypothetical protein
MGSDMSTRLRGQSPGTKDDLLRARVWMCDG